MSKKLNELRPYGRSDVIQVIVYRKWTYIPPDPTPTVGREMSNKLNQLKIQECLNNNPLDPIAVTYSSVLMRKQEQSWSPSNSM